MISWRRFNILLRSLSQASATVTRLSSGQYIGGKEKVNTVVGEKAVNAAFDAAFKPPKTKGKRKK